MRKQEVLLIRHGQSTANASGVWQGQLDFTLSEEGRLQAAKAGRALKDKEISGIYASPLARAFEDACRPMNEQIRTLTQLNDKLRTARDLLVPRLMSGEIAV